MDPAAHEPAPPAGEPEPITEPVTELPEQVVLELDARIAAAAAVAQSVAPGVAQSDDPDQVARDLRLDRAMAAAHSRLASEVVAAGDSSLCRECHEPRPCTTTTDIAAKYALTP